MGLLCMEFGILILHLIADMLGWVYRKSEMGFLVAILIIFF